MMIRELVILTLLLTVFAQWDIEEYTEKKRSQKYCGDVLNRALFILCEGLYNSPNKKSNDYFNYPEFYPTEFFNDVSQDYRFPFHPKTRAMSSFEYRRLKRGVYDECCRKSCSINEIKGYCLKRS